MAVNNVKTDHVHYVRTNVDDDKVSVYYNSDTNNIFVGHDEDGDGDRTDIQASQGIGVYLHTKVNGVWTTTPQAISIGGTGATERRLAAANLGLEAVDGQVMESNNVPIMGYVTENATRLILNFPTHVQTYGIRRVVINSLTGVLRGDKGYIDSNNAVRNLLASPFSTTIVKRHTGLFIATVQKNAAFTNVTNNTPVCCMISYKFTMYDS